MSYDYDPHDEPEPEEPATCPACNGRLEFPWSGSSRAICPNCLEDDE